MDRIITFMEFVKEYEKAHGEIKSTAGRIDENGNYIESWTFSDGATIHNKGDFVRVAAEHDGFKHKRTASLTEITGDGIDGKLVFLELA